MLFNNRKVRSRTRRMVRTLQIYLYVAWQRLYVRHCPNNIHHHNLDILGDLHQLWQTFRQRLSTSCVVSRPISISQPQFHQPSIRDLKISKRLLKHGLCRNTRHLGSKFHPKWQKRYKNRNKKWLKTKIMKIKSHFKSIELTPSPPALHGPLQRQTCQHRTVNASYSLLSGTLSRHSLTTLSFKIQILAGLLQSSRWKLDSTGLGGNANSELLIWATFTSVNPSFSCWVYIHHLLGLPPPLVRTS